MLTSPDFKELLSLLKKHKVRYLVVGGYADLIKAKEASGRPQDLMDAEKLRKAEPSGPGGC